MSTTPNDIEVIVLDESSSSSSSSSSSTNNSTIQMNDDNSEAILYNTNYVDQNLNGRKKRQITHYNPETDEPPAKKKSIKDSNEKLTTMVDELGINENLKNLPLLPLKYFYYYKTSNDLSFASYIQNESIDSNIKHYRVFDLFGYYKNKHFRLGMNNNNIQINLQTISTDKDEFFHLYSMNQNQYTINQSTDFKDSFYINNHSFYIDINNDELSEIDMKRTQFYLYESVKHFRSFEKASYVGNLHTRGGYYKIHNNRFEVDYDLNYGVECKDLVEFKDQDFYLFCLTTKNTATKYIITKLYKIDLDKNKEFNRALFTLISNHSIEMKIKSIDIAESTSLSASNNQLNKLKITVDLYFSSKHLMINPNENPSILARNNSSMDMHYLMTYFFFSRQLSSIHLNPSQIDESKINNKTNNENFFDMVYDLHKNDKSINNITDYEYDHIKELSNLRPILRPYQVKAIKWMLLRENFKLIMSEEKTDEESLNDDDLHELYSKVTNELGQTIYYHKYYGLYCVEKPLKLKSENGGILADEMGLGKTVEVLALISINQCNDYISDEHVNSIQDILNDEKFCKSIKLAKENSFSCICNKVPERFSNYNLQELTNRSRKLSKTTAKSVESLVYRCKLCEVYSHVDCVNYKGDEKDFLCMFCSTKIPMIKSKATLVVTPSIISHQWADEIKKHVDKNLKILIYTGINYTGSNGFVQPRDLAKLDIVITTYDVLSQELSHVFAIENKRQLRNVSRYMTIPSPINCIRWWRIVLDEAQMVHSTNSKCAEMAHRLAAVNRWCVTGTPIGRSLTDLHGLFVFIREDPYNEKKWFNEQLFEPYIHDDRLPMAKAVSKVLWRSSKRHVSDQIDIPLQTEKLYWLDFSPFEKHLYDRVRELFREKRKLLFNKTNLDNEIHTRSRELKNIIELFETCPPNLKLDELDRSKLSQLLSPILDLRLTCNHPQLILRKRSFMTQTRHQDQNKLLTMEKSLEMLLKKTQNESDSLYRTLIMHRNALAGIHIIMHEYDKAIAMYQKVLDSERLDYEYNVKLDLLQKIHAYYNYIQVLKIKLNTILDEEENQEIINKIKQLEYNLIDYEKIYSINYDESKSKDENKMIDKMNEVNENLDKLLKSNRHTNRHHKWWIEMLNNIETSSKERKEEFWNKINCEFGSANSIIIDHDSLCYLICGKSVKTFNELKFVIVEEMDSLLKYRENLLEKLQNLSTIDTEKRNRIVQKAADCHLRRDMLISKIINKKNFSKKKKEYKQLFEAPKCQLCVADHSFKTYVKHLFSNKNDIMKSSRYDPDEDDFDEEDFDRVNLKNDFESDNDFEDEEAEFENKQLESATNRSDLEKFFKLIHFMSKHDKLALRDEIETGKEFLEFFNSLKEEFKLMRKFYIKSSDQINALDELEMCKIRMRLLQPNENNTYELDYIIKENEIDGQFFMHHNSSIESESNLKRKLGQLHYLKNLQKTFLLEEGKENEDPCPICMQNIGYSWYVLACGHSFCVDCFKDLVKNECYSEKLKCALCRVINPRKEACLVSTKKEQDPIEKQTPVSSTTIDCKGNNSIDYKNNHADELASIKIKGNCNSAKVEGIVKLLQSLIKRDKTAKILIFSEHLTILELIIDLIQDNFIFYKYIKDTQSLHKNINLFKTDPGINVLLMPYSFGANGLNIIEATHVILAEPTLNKSQEIQAIGRIHRIGQTKPTFVHRFFIRDSIEELVYTLFKSSSSYSDKSTCNIDLSKPNCSKNFNQVQNDQVQEENALTMGDIKNLFLNL